MVVTRCADLLEILEEVLPTEYVNLLGTSIPRYLSYYIEFYYEGRFFAASSEQPEDRPVPIPLLSPECAAMLLLGQLWFILPRALAAEINNDAYKAFLASERAYFHTKLLAQIAWSEQDYA